LNNFVDEGEMTSTAEFSRQWKEKTGKIGIMLLGAKTIGIVPSIKYASFCLGVRMKRALRKPKMLPKNQDVLLVSLPRHGIGHPPLGIARLKGFLAEQGISCSCLDLNIKLYLLIKKKRPTLFMKRGENPFFDDEQFREFLEDGFSSIIDDWAKEILSLNPRFVGFSATSIFTLNPLKELIRRLRSEKPDMTIIIGGQACKDLGGKLITDYRADIVVLGMGERTFPQIVRALKEKGSLKGIKGVIYSEGGSVVEQGGEEPLGSLSSLPLPNFEDFDLSLYQTTNILSVSCSLPIAASNGCNRNCTFCTYRHLLGAFEQRSSRSVFEEMLHHKRAYGTCSFAFADAMLNADVKFLEELCDLIIESGEVFSWGGQFGFKEGMPKQLIRKMAKAGCNSLAIGLESGSEKIRKDMLKPCSQETIVNMLKEFHQVGIRYNTINFIIGYPTETREDFEKSLEFINAHHRLIYRVNISLCHVLEGTILSTIAARKGFVQGGPLDWSYGDNTPQERKRRMDEMNAVAKRLHLIRPHVAGDY
jgi:radical SAM superfamily enzyme YgiQ (UPF0313 family)